MIRRGLILVACVACTLVIPALPAWACEEAFFSPASYTAGENDGSVVLTVQNPFPRQGPRTVEYATVTGTAKSGSDYVGETGTLSFSGNDTKQTVSIKIVDDSTSESSERFYVKLKLTPDSCIVKVGPAAMVTIQDQDAAPKPAPPREDESASTPAPEAPQGSAPEQPGPAAGVPPPDFDDRPSPSTPTPTGSATPAERGTDQAPLAASPDEEGGGGLSWLATAGIVFLTLLVGSTAVVYVRDRFLTTPPPS